MRNGAEPAAHPELEAAHLLAVLDPRLRDETEVMHVDETARFVGTTGERRLELATEALHVRMAEQEAHERLGVGRDVERLRLADACERTRGDVAHRVAARFPGGDAHR